MFFWSYRFCVFCAFNLTVVDLLEFIQHVSPSTLTSSHILILHLTPIFLMEYLLKFLFKCRVKYSEEFICNPQLADTDGSSIVPLLVNKQGLRCKLLFNLWIWSYHDALSPPTTPTYENERTGNYNLKLFKIFFFILVAFVFIL